jgi:hypothetical protein
MDHATCQVEALSGSMRLRTWLAASFCSLGRRTSLQIWTPAASPPALLNAYLYASFVLIASHLQRGQRKQSGFLFLCENKPIGFPRHTESASFDLSQQERG